MRVLIGSINSVSFLLSWRLDNALGLNAASATRVSNKTEDCTEKEQAVWPFQTSIIGKVSPEGSGKRMTIGGEEESRK